MRKLKGLLRITVARRIVLAGAPFMLLVLFPTYSDADPRADLAKSLLHLGGATGQLLWSAATTPAPLDSTQILNAQKFGESIQHQLDQGRAVANVVQAPFQVASTAIGATVFIAPTPMTFAVKAIAQYTLDSTGNYLAKTVYGQVENSQMSLLKRALADSNMSPAQLYSLAEKSPADLNSAIDKLQIDHETLGSILKDNPNALELIHNASLASLTNLGAAALNGVVALSGNVNSIKAKTIQLSDQFDEFQKSSSAQLQAIDTDLDTLDKKTDSMANDIGNLTTSVQNNTAELSSIESVSFSGWSSAQKVQALQEGLFPDIVGDDRVKLTETYQLDVERKDTSDHLAAVSQDFGNLAIIGKALKVDPGVVEGLNTAQIAATALSQAATGNYIGAIAAIAGIPGLGGGGGNQNAAVIAFMQQEFEKVNVKLDKVIELQKTTLKAIDNLSTKIDDFRTEVMTKLGDIEDEVLINQHILQRLAFYNWRHCKAVGEQGPFNGTLLLINRPMLDKALDPHNPTPIMPDLISCLTDIWDFRNNEIAAADFGGDIFSYVDFDGTTINPALTNPLSPARKARLNAFHDAQAYMHTLFDPNQADSTTDAFAIQFLLLLHPDSDLLERDAFLDALKADPGGVSYRCHQSSFIEQDMAKLLCQGVASTTVSPPTKDRFLKLIDAAMLGPQVLPWLNKFLLIARLADFVYAPTPQANLLAVTTAELKNITAKSLGANMNLAADQHFGSNVLHYVAHPLSYYYLLQQSLFKGDYIASSIFSDFWDGGRGSLSAPDMTSPNPSALMGRQRLAWAVLKSNPTVAENVVMLAMRTKLRQYTDTVHGTNAPLGLTDYLLAYLDAIGPAGNFNKLATIFSPDHWNFTVSDGKLMFRFTLADSSFIDVLAPLPPTMERGTFQRGSELDVALALNDSIVQSILDRDIAQRDSTLLAPQSAQTLVAMLDEKSIFSLASQPGSQNHPRLLKAQNKKKARGTHRGKRSSHVPF